MNKCGFINSIIRIFEIIPGTFLIILLYFFVSIYRALFLKEKKYLSVIFWIIITFLFNTISLTIYSHYLISFLPIIMLSYNNLFTIFNKKIVCYVIFIFVLCFGINNAFTSIPYLNVSQPNLKIIEYIKNNTLVDDKIAVIGFYDEIYYLSNKDSISKYTYVLSNGAFSRKNQTMIVSEYFNDIIVGKPSIIVEDSVVLEKGVKPYINLENYNILKESFYQEKLKINAITVYQLNEY